VTSTSTYSNTQKPETSGQQNTGSVAPSTPPTSVTQGLTDSNGNSLVQ